MPSVTTPSPDDLLLTSPDETTNSLFLLFGLTLGFAAEFWVAMAGIQIKYSHKLVKQSFHKITTLSQHQLIILMLPSTSIIHKKQLIRMQSHPIHAQFINEVDGGLDSLY